MKRLLPVLLSTLFSLFIVRHAEKAAAPKDDPPLTKAGRARAQELARVLGDVPLKAVYATEFERTVKPTPTPSATAVSAPPPMRTARSTGGNLCEGPGGADLGAVGASAPTGVSA